MSTPDDDTDPTGMRALLRALPDPGPMPDELVGRIQASLTDLAEESGQGVLRDSGHARSDPGVSRGTPARQRSSWLVRNGSKLAVAAVVLVGGGAAVQLVGSTLNEGMSAGSSSDSAVDSGAESLSDAPGAAPRGGDDTDSEAEGARSGPIVVTMSGRAYTSDGLASQVGDATNSPRTAPLTAESPGIGPIGTEIGVRSCLQALGFPRVTAADVDLGLVDGNPAAVLVVTAGGERTAYAVGRECTLGNPAVLAGPVPLS